MRLVHRSFAAPRSALLPLALALVALSCLAGSARAAFDSRGTAILDLPSPSLSKAYGKRMTLLAVGFGDDRKLVRLRSNGAVDTSFGEDGQVRIDATDLAVTADGKILVLGRGTESEVGFDPTVTRLMPDGALDRSFGGGTITVDLGGTYDYGSSIAVDHRGRILVGGSRSDVRAQRGFAPSSLTVVRLRPGGAVDRDFGRAGTAQLSDEGSEASVSEIALGPRGSIFLSSNGWEVFKLRPDGSPDRGFGERGKVVTRELWSQIEDGYLDAVDGIGVTKGGKVVIAGTHSYSVGDRRHYRAAALRLLSDGRLDRRYGEGGLATARVGSWFFAGSMLLRRNGRLVVAGNSQQPAGHDSAFAAIGFNPRGRLDQTFGQGGKMRVDLGDTWTMNSGIVPRPRGRAMLTGWTMEGPDSPGGLRGLALAMIDLYNGKRR
jgi:uncharacterized delta-60 repeat protein